MKILLRFQVHQNDGAFEPDIRNQNHHEILSILNLHLKQVLFNI
jgi:hypothetical protein